MKLIDQQKLRQEVYDAHEELDKYIRCSKHHSSPEMRAYAKYSLVKEYALLVINLEYEYKELTGKQYKHVV